VRGKNSEVLVRTGEPSISGGVPLKGVDGREDLSAGLNGGGCVEDELDNEGGLFGLDVMVRI
jgi:hypothetical protein